MMRAGFGSDQIAMIGKAASGRSRQAELLCERYEGLQLIKPQKLVQRAIEQY